MSRFFSYLLIFTLCALSVVKADRRSFVWVYQYMTLPAGETELEFYQTTRIANLDAWEYRFEVEHGLTDHLDFSVYQIFSQSDGTPFRWDAVQFRMRYRLGYVGKYFLDPLFYLEYKRKLDGSAPNKVEAKLILGKRIGSWGFAMNPVYELYFAPGTEQEIGFDFGGFYEFSPRLSVGLESVSRMEFEDGEGEVATYLGPTVSFASGEWWYNAGIIMGLNKNSDDFRVRFLMGIEL